MLAPLALAASSCARDATAPVSIWAMSKEGENLPVLTRGFERETGIAVDVQAVPWTAAHEKFLTAYAGASLPDILMLSVPYIAEFAAIGAIAPMPAYARPLLRDQFDAELAQTRVGGRAYALPWTAGPQAQFFRRDLLARIGHEAPPADWASWKAACHALVRQRPGRYAVLLMLNWPEPLMEFAAQFPDRPLRDRDARGNFSSPGFREALGFYKSLFDEGLAPPVLSTEIADPLTLFARGWFAMLPGAPYIVGDLRDRAADIAPSLWGVAAMPGPAGPAPGVVGVNALGVTSTARNPEKAWRLLGYLCRPDVQLRFHALTGLLPTRPSAWRAPALADDAIARTFRAQIARARPAPVVAEWQHIVDEVQLVAERMVRRNMPVAAAAREMDARADAILAKRRWLLDRGTIA